MMSPTHVSYENVTEASENMEFEEAIRYRDLYNSVKQVSQKNAGTCPFSSVWKKGLWEILPPSSL